MKVDTEDRIVESKFLVVKYLNKKKISQSGNDDDDRIVSEEI